MTDTLTHRCIDCPQKVEHLQADLCPSCGRCKVHCHGNATATRAAQLSNSGDHILMKRIGEDA